MLAETNRAAEDSTPFRFGLPSELVDLIVPVLAGNVEFGKSKRKLEVRCDASERLLGDFHDRVLDAALVISADPCMQPVHWQSKVPLCWYSSPTFSHKAKGAIPLVTGTGKSILHYASVSTLRKKNREFDIVCSSDDFNVRKSAIRSGAGVGLMFRNTVYEGLVQIDIEMSEFYLGLYIRNEVFEDIPNRLLGQWKKILSDISAECSS